MSVFMFKVLSASLLILTPIFTYIICKFFRLGRLGIKFPDITIPLYIFEIIVASSQFFKHSFIYYYLIAIAILAIVVASWQFLKTKTFTYKRWFKFFWRLNFFLTFFFFLVTLILLFQYSS
ncbi:DUF3397 domain-containing protein [Streptococcus sp. ZJ151]|uniref:DUF3397 domain-containing protein n=2 Tax=Streptococcus jiangjianxini TaxID=3161189 RepID=UPI0032ECF830